MVMQIATAVVRLVSGDVVEIEISSSGCGRCSEPGGCGGQNLSRALCGTPKRFWIKNSIGASTGDSVRVAIDSSGVHQAATITYVLPLGALLCGAMLGSMFGNISSVIGGIGGLVIAWFHLSHHKLELNSPVLIERLSKPE